jgi:hypothetical protein
MKCRLGAAFIGGKRSGEVLSCKGLSRTTIPLCAQRGQKTTGDKLPISDLYIEFLTGDLLTSILHCLNKPRG